LRIKEQETGLILHEHNDDDDVLINCTETTNRAVGVDEMQMRKPKEENITEI
jgi:hypothetical protein